MSNEPKRFASLSKGNFRVDGKEQESKEAQERLRLLAEREERVTKQVREAEQLLVQAQEVSVNNVKSLLAITALMTRMETMAGSVSSSIEEQSKLNKNLELLIATLLKPVVPVYDKSGKLLHAKR